MTVDSKGNRHQPKGTPGAGRFASKMRTANSGGDLNGGDFDTEPDATPSWEPPRHPWNPKGSKYGGQWQF